MCIMTITTSKNCAACVCDHMPEKYLHIHAAAKHEVAVRLFGKGLCLVSEFISSWYVLF